MRLIVFIVFITPFANAKCGLHREFDRHHNSGGNSDRGYGYGYQSLSYAPFCNDIEMSEQCKRAQTQIDKFVWVVTRYLMINSVTIPGNFPQTPDLRCSESIACYLPFTGNEIKYCENLDLYDKCQSASFVLGDFITLASNTTNISPVLPLVPEFVCTTSVDPVEAQGYPFYLYVI